MSETLNCCSFKVTLRRVNGRHTDQCEQHPTCGICGYCRSHCLEHHGLMPWLTRLTMVPGDQFNRKLRDGEEGSKQ